MHKFKRMLAGILSAAVAVTGLPATPLYVQASNPAETVLEMEAMRRTTAVSYARDFAEGMTGFERVSGSGTLKMEDGAAVMSGEGVFIDQDSISARDTEAEFTFNPQNISTNYGVILRYTDNSNYLYVGPQQQHGQHYTSWGVYGPSGLLQEISDEGFILDNRKTPYKVKVRAVGKVITVFVDNEEIYSGQVDGITENAGKTGFRTTAGTSVKVYGFRQNEVPAAAESTAAVETAQISSPDMTVTMDRAFPRVISYALAGGGSAAGQEKPVYRVEINNRVYDNAVVTTETAADKMIYHMSVADGAVTYAFDVQYQVSGNVLEMKLLNIQDEQDKIYTINFPEQFMVSMRGDAANGKLRVNNYSAETRYDLSSMKAQGGYSTTTLAVLSCDGAAATISGESYKNRKEIAYKTVDCADHTSTGLWLNEFTYRGVDGEIEIAQPWVKAAVVADRNGDQKVDYQDGAVALRDLCRARKTGADVVNSTWSMIAMNVGSEAQYPFLRILDNIKKISLATDGFGQNVIIKGYQSEGHDAAHPDFANYNKRAGGLEDLNVLLQEAEKYHAKVGIHINHTEAYPEAPQFGKLASSLGGWSWYDSSNQIVRENDCLDQTGTGLDARLSQLFDKDTANALDTVYVDVYFGSRWPYYKLVSNINGRNMVLGTEYTNEMVSYSSFAHHIGSDFGGAGNLVRIVDNGQADIFTSHPLFRGANSRANDQVGIDGWQTAKNMYNALDAFYTMILPNKYLANFEIMQYETDQKAVLGADGEVVTEMAGGVNVITKDGKKVAEGNKMFIPWDPKTEEKIYHYNQSGGSSSWQLPDSWGNVTSVKLYKLSDEGKTLAGTLNVSNGQVTIDAEAKTGYVLYKGTEEDAGLTAESMDWSTGSPVKDMGFDSHGFTYWTRESGNVVLENNSLGNTHLYIRGRDAGAVSQTLTGLTPGQSYSASVWTITDAGRKASIQIDNGGELLENYMTRSNVTYGYHHNDKYQTKAQRMAVRFVAKSDTAKLTLSAEEGASDASQVDFDDVRVMKCGITDPGEHTYYEDFENVDQGVGIFTSTESDQSHLSQRNPRNPQYTTDVIDGEYSLKVRAGDYMRTLPSTVRFRPNMIYTVGLSYKTGTAGAFTMAIKSDKANEAGDTAHAVLAQKQSVLGGQTVGTLELKVTTGNYDDYYLDITRAAGTEYCIDNVYIDEERPKNAETLRLLISEAQAYKDGVYTPETLKAVREMAQRAQAVLDAGADETAVVEAYINLENAMDAAQKYAGASEKALLEWQITAMKALKASDYNEDIHWLVFLNALREAQKLLADTKATAVQTEAMVMRLEEAKNALSLKVDRTAIRRAVRRAERVGRNAIVDGFELQTFLTSLEAAKMADQKSGVTQAEITAAADALVKAYENVMIQDASLSTLLDEELAKVQVDEAYYRESDLEKIAEVSEKLSAMAERTGVPVKEFVALSEELEAVLANKTAEPVLSVYQALDGTAFTIVCDNEELPGNASEGPASLAFDNNSATIWHSSYTPRLPANIEVDLNGTHTIGQFGYQCRPNGENGKVQRYDLSCWDQASGSWKTLVEGGSFSNDGTEEKVRFKQVTTNKVKFTVTEGAGGFASAAELKLYTRSADLNDLQQAVYIYRNELEQSYEAASLAELKGLIDRAQAMLSGGASQDEADALYIQIQTARKKLSDVPTIADKKVMQEILDEAKSVSGAITDAYRQALAAAEQALAAGKSQTAISAALVKLYQERKAMESGTSVPVVTKKNISAATVSSIKKQAYTGKPLCPSVKVTLAGQTLALGRDYTVSYKNHVNPGKATVTITGTGNYQGTKQVTFKIVPKKRNLKSVKRKGSRAMAVKWTRDKKADGYQIWYSTSKSFKKGTRKLLVKKGKTVSWTIKKLKSKKTYYVKIRAYKTIDKKKEFGAFGKVKKIRIK